MPSVGIGASPPGTSGVPVGMLQRTSACEPNGSGPICDRPRPFAAWQPTHASLLNSGPSCGVSQWKSNGPLPTWWRFLPS